MEASPSSWIRLARLKSHIHLQTKKTSRINLHQSLSIFTRFHPWLTLGLTKWRTVELCYSLEAKAKHLREWKNICKIRNISLPLKNPTPVRTQSNHQQPYWVLTSSSATSALDCSITASSKSTKKWVNIPFLQFLLKDNSSGVSSFTSMEHSLPTSIKYKETQSASKLNGIQTKPSSKPGKTARLDILSSMRLWLNLERKDGFII